MRVTGFDHLVLAVADVDRSLAWYTDVVGLTPVRVEEWRRGDAPFPSVRVDAATIIDLVPRGVGAAGSNLDHFCLVSEPAEPAEPVKPVKPAEPAAPVKPAEPAAPAGSVDLVGWAAGAGLTVIDGPGPRFGAQGVATSIYVKDPDGNIVEFRQYP